MLSGMLAVRQPGGTTTACDVLAIAAMCLGCHQRGIPTLKVPASLGRARKLRPIYSCGGGRRRLRYSTRSYVNRTQAGRREFTSTPFDCHGVAGLDELSPPKCTAGTEAKEDGG